MSINPIIILLLACILVSACVGQELPAQGANPAPWDPVPGDSEMQRVEIEQVSVEIISLESDPPQFALRIEGALPTPCHLLRVEVSSSEDQASKKVEIYSVVDPVQMCIQILEPFSEEIPLGDSQYQVIVNNKVVKEISP
jgi:hypothetical protein